MGNQTFNAGNGFHLANVGTDRNVSMCEEVCLLEKSRIAAANRPEIAGLEKVRAVLERERSSLQSVVDAGRSAIANATWPIWRTVITVILIAASFALTRMSLEPFDFDPVLMWICAVGIACLCAYGTAEFLERTEHPAIVLGIAIVLFIASIAGLMTLGSIRGDIFIHHLQTESATGDDGNSSDGGMKFYEGVAPKMQWFLILLSFALELAAGLALHAVRVALRARSLAPLNESRRLRSVHEELSHIDVRLTFLRHEPEIFEHEYRRNLYIGLLSSAVRKARASGNWPVALTIIAVLGIAPTLRGQGVDLWEGLDLTATSKAAGYDGAAAYAENVDAVARMLRAVPAGSKITVAGISDQSFSRPFILLSGTLPHDHGKLSEYDQVAAAQGRLAASLRRIGTNVEPRFLSTDILGFLMFAGMELKNSHYARRVLVIHSDMRQSARPLDIESPSAVQIEAALRTVQAQHLIPDLSGIDVFVYGVHDVGKDIRYWQSLRDFWGRYFALSGGALRGFSMMRETPDLAAAH